MIIVKNIALNNILQFDIITISIFLGWKMYRVMMTIKGKEVPSSCVKTGLFLACQDSAEGLNRSAHPDVKWVVLPCIES